MGQHYATNNPKQAHEWQHDLCLLITTFSIKAEAQHWCNQVDTLAQKPQAMQGPIPLGMDPGQNTLHPVTGPTRTYPSPPNPLNPVDPQVSLLDKLA